MVKVPFTNRTLIAITKVPGNTTIKKMDLKFSPTETNTGETTKTTNITASESYIIMKLDIDMKVNSKKENEMAKEKNFIKL